LVTRWDDCKHVERNHDIFTTREDKSFMIRTFGLSMLRTDGDEHKRLRAAVASVMRPKDVKEIWGKFMAEDVDLLIEKNYHKGEMDLVNDFAGPFAAQTLKHLLSLHEAGDQEMIDWSVNFMAGIGNLSNDPAIWERTDKSNTRIDELLEPEIKKSMDNPNETVLSSMIHNGFSIEEIRANVKLFISGGLNEPKDAITSTVWGLLTHPEQLNMAKQDPTLYQNAAEEAMRLWSPLAMFPRQTTKDTTIGDVELKKGTKLYLVIASANRDKNKWENPDKFDITRDKIKTHMAFSLGSHFCVGTHIAREQLKHAIPSLFSKLRNLRLDESRPTNMVGYSTRGFENLYVKWDV
jgi:cytochrome P450